MRYFVSGKNWLMVQFIGYNVEGGSAYHRGEEAIWLVDTKPLCRRKTPTSCIYSHLFEILGRGGSELTSLYCQRVASPVFTQVQIETDGGRTVGVPRPDQWCHRTIYLNWRQHRILFSQLFPDPHPQFPTTKPPKACQKHLNGASLKPKPRRKRFPTG